MHEVLRERILRRLDALPDERIYQVLDYIEFLESKYAARQPVGTGIFQRFAEGVEDTMRAGKVSAQTIAETMNLMSRAMGVLSGAMAAGKSVATDVVSAATRVPPRTEGSAPQASPAAPAAQGAPAPSSPAPEAQQPPAPPPTSSSSSATGEIPT